MINNLEGKSRKELVEIVKIQIEEYQKLQKQNELSEKHRLDLIAANSLNRKLLDDKKSLEKQLGFEMEQKSTARQQRNEAGRKFQEIQKQNAELVKELFNIREVLNIQEDKNCLGTGYPINKNECAPWPIVDEIINRITQALKDGES